MHDGSRTRRFQLEVQGARLLAWRFVTGASSIFRVLFLFSWLKGSTKLFWQGTSHIYTVFYFEHYTTVMNLLYSISVCYNLQHYVLSIYNCTVLYIKLWGDHCCQAFIELGFSLMTTDLYIESQCWIQTVSYVKHRSYQLNLKSYPFHQLNYAFQHTCSRNRELLLNSL